MINEHGLYENWLKGHQAGVLTVKPYGVEWFKRQVDEIRSNHIQHQANSDAIRASVRKVQDMPIIQLSRDGQIVDKFETIARASSLTGIDLTAISKCVMGQTKTAGGFQWRRI